MSCHFYIKLLKYFDRFDRILSPLLSLVIFTGYFMWRMEVGSPFPRRGFDSQVSADDEALGNEVFWYDVF